MATLEQLTNSLKAADAAGDTAAAQTLANAIRKMQAQPAAPKVGMGEDVVRGMGSGAKTGLEQLAGTVEDTGNLGGTAVKKVAGWLGFQPSTAEAAGQTVSNAVSAGLNPIGGATKLLKAAGGPDLTRLYAPTSQTVREDVEAAVPAAKKLNYDPQTKLGKFAKTGTEFATGAVAGEARLPAILRRVAEQTGIGFLSEGAGQATEGSAFEPYARFGTGLLGAGLLSSAVRKGPVTPQAQRLLDEGIDLSAGQATGSKGLKIFESELGGGTTQSLAERQREQFTARAMQEVGAPAGSLATPENMLKQRNRIGAELDRVERAVGDVPISVEGQQGMMDAVKKYTDGVGTPAPVVGNTVRDIGRIMTGNGTAVLNGEQLAGLRTRIREAADGADFQTAEALRGLQTQLDNAIETHVKTSPTTAPELADEWAKARQQYRLYLDLERTAANAPAHLAGEGLFTPAGLRGGVKGVEGNRRLVTGQSEFTPLANDASVAMSPIPSSETAARSAARAGPTTMAGGTALGHPFAALAATLAPFGAGKLLMSQPVQKMLMSAPENARAALTALIAAQQARQRQEGRR